MSDWADRFFDKIKAKEGSEHDTQQFQAARREQVLAQAPHLWQEVRSTLLENVRKFQEEKRSNYLTLREIPGDTPNGPSHAIVVRSPEREIEVSYFDRIPRIQLDSKFVKGMGGKKIEMFSFKVVDDEVELFANGYGVPISVEAAAEYMLDKLRPE